MNEKNSILTLTASVDNEGCCSDTGCCPAPATMTRAEPKVGRNDPCPYCKSGKKYKKCCGL
jgi:hypothetical protein